MARSVLKPGVLLTRAEKKALHKANPKALLGKGRRKYQTITSYLYSLVCELAKPREVDWTAIISPPPLFKPGVRCEEVDISDVNIPAGTEPLVLFSPRVPNYIPEA